MKNWLKTNKFDLVIIIIVITTILSFALIPELHLFKNKYILNKNFCHENIAQYSVLNPDNGFDLYVAHKGDERSTDFYLIDLDSNRMNQLELHNFSLYITAVDDYFKSFYDEEENKIYTLVTQNRADYYLLEFDAEETLMNHQFYFLYHDNLYDQLLENSIEIAGINFTGFNTSESLADSIKIISDNKNHKIIMNESIFMELRKKSHLNFREFSLSIQMSKLMSSYLNCHFKTEDLFKLIHFYSRNSYYQNHRLYNSKKINKGFLNGDILARIDVNNDGIKEFLIQISGDRWLPSKLICYDKKHNKILWTQEFCGDIKNSKLIDVNNDNKKEIVASTYSPLNSTPIDYFEKNYFNSTLYSSLFIFDQNGEFLQVNNAPLIVHSEQGYFFHKFTFFPKKNELVFGLSSKHDSSSKHLKLWKLDENRVTDLEIDYIDLLAIDIKKHDLIMIHKTEDAIEEIRYSSRFKLLDKKEYLTDSHQDFDYNLGKINGINVSLSKYPTIFLDDNLRKIVEIDEHMRLPILKNNCLYFVREDDYLSTLMQVSFSQEIIWNYLAIIYILSFFLFITLIYLLHFQIVLPMKSNLKSYFIYFRIIGFLHYWNFRGKISNQIILTKKYSFSKKTMNTTLMEFDDSPHLLYQKNFLLFKYTVYEIQSHDESEIIQRISHDMKNQVLMMKMLTDQHAEEIKEKNTTYLQRMTDSITNVSEAAQTLSKFSHIDKLYKEKIELNMFIKQILMNHVEHQNFQAIKFEPSEEEIEIMVDENLIRIALDNLIMNALEEIDNDQKIAIKLQKLKSEIILTISNPINRQKYKIEEFGNVGFSSKPKGSGIGLPIAKVIVERHDGELKYNVENSEFILEITLPVT